MQKNKMNEPLSKKYDELYKTLRSYLHQDAGSFAAAEIEILNDPSEWLERLWITTNRFLEDKDVSVEDKKMFIQTNCSLSFSFFHLDPLTWLQNLAEKIKQKINAKSTSS